MSTVNFRYERETNKPKLEFILKSKVDTYNVLNKKELKDYHANNTMISLSCPNITINKINMYNPLMKNLFENFTNNKEVCNNKFKHELLYVCNDIFYKSKYKLTNQYNEKNLYDMEKNIKGYINHRHFYRIELIYSFCNDERNFETYDELELNAIFYIFKKYFSNKKYVKFKLYCDLSSSHISSFGSGPIRSYFVV